MSSKSLSSRNAGPVHRILKSAYDVASAIYEFDRKFENLAGVSLVQWRLLCLLKEMPGCSLVRLAMELGITPGSLTPLVARVRARNYIFLSEDQNDGRKRKAFLTEKGFEIIEKVDSLNESTLREISQELPNLVLKV